MASKEDAVNTKKVESSWRRSEVNKRGTGKQDLMDKFFASALEIYIENHNLRKIPINTLKVDKAKSVNHYNYTRPTKFAETKPRRCPKCESYLDSEWGCLFIKCKYSSITEVGESSNSKDPTFICQICIEPKPQKESFNIKGCSHSYCSDCMTMYIGSKLQENITVIRCPEPICLGVLEPEFCRSILPQEVFDRWGRALCESLIPGRQKFYCPFKDCSALLIDDGGIVVIESECPHCGRLFCAQCKVPWHSEITCKEFQKLNEGEREREDLLLMKLAKESKWQRCPKCKFYVERSDGCLFMKCRCGFAFCYNCAAPMDNNSHNCSKCNR